MPIAKKRNRRPSVRTRRNLAAFFESLEDRRLMAVVQPGFSESLYKAALPFPPTAITVDTASGDLYYTEPNTNGVLQKVAADAGRTLTTVTSDFTPPSAGSALFPYSATDIQYHAGAVYTVISDNATGHLVRIDTTTGQTTVLQSIGGAGYEAGVEIVSTPGAIYFTDGQGAANSLFRFSLITGGVTTVVSNLPPNSYGLELNPADGKLYFARQGEGFFRVDENLGGTSTITQISNHPTGVGNFAIDPLGEHIYVRVGGNIQRISLATGVSQIFATGLANNSATDLAFGPSSSGNGYSLYVGNENTLLEYSGFGETPEPPSPGEIRGSKWGDFDGDGVRDASEPGLANVVVYIDSNRDGQLNAGEPQATTDASGNYRFENVQPGHYVVREVIPVGYRQTSPGANRDFYYGWDGIQQALVTIDAVTGDVSSGVPTSGFPLHGIAQTNDGTLYGIHGGADALYRIDPVSGIPTLVGPTGVQLAFGLAYDPQSDVLYGLATPPGQPSGTVQLVEFNRSTGQVTFIGTQPTVGLTGTSGITFDTVSRRIIAFDNADDEFYAFDPQSGIGTRLMFARPGVASFGLSQDGLGNVVFQTGNFLGRINLTTGQASPFLPLSRQLSLESLELVDFEEFGHRVTVGSGEIVSGVDFGNQSVLSTVSGSKWEDLDGDGTRDAGEPAMAGVVVFLDANNNGVLDSDEPQTTTDADGTYVFTGLMPGRYTVREVLPANYQQTSPGDYADFFWAYDTNNRRVVKIDAATGAATPIGAPGSIGNGPDIHGLAYTNDGELYGISGNSGSLYRIDTTTGQATQIRGTGMPLARGLAYDSATDTLYGLATPPGFASGNVQPVIFNRQSGGATFIGSQVTTGLTGTSGLAFDSVSGRLIAFDNADDEVYAFNVVTGIGTRLGVSGTPLHSGAMADDGKGNVILPTGGGLVRMNLNTRQVTQITGPLAGVSIEALELVHREDFAHTLYVGPAENISGVDFGNQSVAGSITGTKWEDLDGDGVRGVDEPAMTGVVVYLDLNRDGDLDPDEPQAITDASGVYQFTSVLPGSYLVREVAPENYRQTSPGVQRDFFWAFDWQTRNIVKIDALSGEVTPIGGPGSINTGVNMHGLVQTNDGTLFGTSGTDNSLYRIDTTTGAATFVGPTGAVLAWGLAYDKSTDTIYGVGRPISMPGGSLKLLTIDRNTGMVSYVSDYVATGILSATGMTFDATTGKVLLHDRNTGRYFSIDPTTGEFTQLPVVHNSGTNGLASNGAGQLIVQQGGGLVRFDPVTGTSTQLFALTPYTAIDSLELIQFTAFAHEVFLGPAEHVSGINFGNQSVLGSISGEKWEDLDGDGVRDAGEPAMANVVVYIDSNRNGSLDAGEPHTTTDASGAYIFDDLLPGHYVVREVLPANYQQTSPGIQRDFFWGFDWQDRRIVKIDAATGLVTPIGDPESIGTPSPRNMHGLVQTADGTLYGISGAGGDNGLYRIDTTTGQATRIGSSGATLAWGLAYDELTNTIYGAAIPPGAPQGTLRLITIDPNTGTATFIGTESITGVSSTTGMTFDPVTRQVVLHDRNTGRFFSIDPETGEFTLVSTRFFNTNALAIDSAGQLIVHQGNALVRYDMHTGTTSTFMVLSTSVSLDSLELIHFTNFAHAVYVGPAQDVVGRNFGNQSVLGTLSGQKFEDLDGDGIRDPEEPAMANVVIYLDANNNGQLDAGETQTTTDATGKYTFTSLLPGSHVVREVLLTGYEQTSPGLQRDFFYAMDAASRRVVKIDALTGQITPLSATYGSVLLTGIAGTTSGQVYGLGSDNALYSVDPNTGVPTRIGFSGRSQLARGLAYDRNTDTLYGLADVGGGQLGLVTFDPATGVATTVGDATVQANAPGIGGLTFEPVSGEVWAIDNSFVRFLAFNTTTGDFREVQTATFIAAGNLSSDGQGNLLVMNGPTLRRINPNTGETFPLLSTSQYFPIEALELQDFDSYAHRVYLSPAGALTNLDFGNRSITSSLSGVKYLDRNGDGVRQADEPGMSGVTVYLDLNFDGELSPDEPSTMTAADGSYSFTNLLPGRYVVREVSPEGYAPSTLNEFEDYYLGYAQGTRQLVFIDPTTGEVTTKVTLMNPPSLNGIVRTNSNEIFALSGPGNALYKVDAVTGEVSLVGSAQRLVAWGLAYDAVTDTIYGLAHPNADLEQLALVRYDRTTGEAIIIGEPMTGARFTSGITFDPVRRKVLAYDNSAIREIYAFDPETGASELLSVVNPPIGGYGLATDNTGYLILSAGPQALIRIDPVTGTWSPHLTLSREVGLEALEFVDFADGGHDIYLAPRTDYVGYDLGNRNIAPSGLQLTLAQSVAEGSPLQLTGTFVDPGSFESHTVEITWGDGTTETIILAPGELSFSASHTYSDDEPTGTTSDPYNIRVRVLDSGAGEATAEQTVEVVNAAPSQLVLIGDASIDENDIGSLSVAFVDPGLLDTHTVTIAWGDGFIQQVDLSAGSRELVLTHLYLDNPSSGSSFVITVTLADDDGSQAIATHELNVLNVAPHVAPIAGPSAVVRGQEVTFSSGFADPGTLDSHEVSWNFGDGTVLPFSAATPGGLSANHVYTSPGNYTVTLTVRDDDGGVSTQQFQVQVGGAMLQDDPLNPGQQMLVVGGTSGNDIILVVPWLGGQVEVLVNNQLFGPFLPQSRIVLYGQEGDDLITSLVSIPTWMYGGDGDDILLGGPGDNVLLGEDGDDELVGGSGDDVMIGGRGEDRLVGSSGSDLLIAGYLSQITEAELDEVHSTWTSNTSYQNRIAALSPILNNQTVLDDAARDMLTGASGLDWYFAELDRGGGKVEDKITGSTRDEEIVDLLANLGP